MKLVLLIPLALLAACASQPPSPMESLHTAAKARISYQNYAQKDWRYVKPTQSARGNCAVFAFTTFIDAGKAGLDPSIHICRLPNGQGHAYTQVEGWASDVRFPHLIPLVQEDCK